MAPVCGQVMYTSSVVASCIPGVKAATVENEMVGPGFEPLLSEDV